MKHAYRKLCMFLWIYRSFRRFCRNPRRLNEGPLRASWSALRFTINAYRIVEGESGR